ncbi:GRIP and coiled-coil domain-containing protein 1-like [Amphiura filiformis]|uniref:GRIP and coiled-coil domain-containing protein 1-like n=1 Tax=Amphiura filiformis TaxID=82378 RepID=UPI003B212A3E
MDRATRKDLLETIEQQKDQLARYEKRLRDVVQAYKNLNKEKEALEASVNALSAAGGQKQQSSASVCSGSDGEGGKHQEGFDDPLGAKDQISETASDDASSTTSQDAGGRHREIDQLKEQVSTLMSSLATVTAGKSKMEATFQADKKKIRLEQEELTKQFTDDREKLQEINMQLQEQLSQSKSKLRSQQQEREQEQIDHAVMLRELQTLLSQERTEKEKLEHKIDDLEDGLAKARSQPDKSSAYEDHIKRMSRELEAVKNQLKESEIKASRPSPLLLQLQREMAELKAQHRMQVDLEQQKSKEAEERLRKARTTEEARVASLEAKLSELSATVGNYDRVKQQDQTAIQRLKERITQLDLENTALARAANKKQISEVEEISNTATVTEIIEKITQLKGLLKLANKDSDKPVDIDEVCNINVEDDSSRCTNPDHRACQNELKQLKEEFERYKTRAQSVLKNKTYKDTSNNKEIETLQSQTNDFRERVSILRQQLDDEEANHKQTVSDYQTKVSHLQERYKQDLMQKEVDYKQRAADLEQQVHRQRDRTMALVAEKDREIDNLRHQLQNKYGAVGGDFPERQISDDASVFTDASGSDDQQIHSDVDETLSQLTKTPSAMVQGNGSSLLHFAEERARKEVELRSIKQQKQQTEGALRQLQDKHMMAVTGYEEHVQQLQDEVERWKRNRSREGTNLEYLKNVVLCYLQTESHSSKVQMFNAIAAILQFTPREKDVVLKKQMAGWWK